MTDPHTVVVRERAPADIPAAAAALVEVHRTDGYPVEGVADPTRWITATDQIRAWVAELDNQIVGHVAISKPQRTTLPPNSGPPTPTAPGESRCSAASSSFPQPAGTPSAADSSRPPKPLHTPTAFDSSSTS